MQEIKAILTVYLLILICLLVSFVGLYLYNQELSIIYLSIILFTMPILAIATIFYQYYRLASNSKAKK